MTAKSKPPAKRPAPTLAGEREEAALEYRKTRRGAAQRRGPPRQDKGALHRHRRDARTTSASRSTSTLLTVFDGKRVRIVMTVVPALEQFDHAGFVEDVGKLGIDGRKLARLVRKHTSTLRPAHVFKTSLVT